MRKAILAFVMCISLFPHTAALGAALNNSVFDRDTEQIIISGTAEKNSDVTIIVLGPEGNAEEITDESLIDSSIVFIKQIQADSKGSYSISFPAKYGTGKYKVRVYSSADEEYSDNMEVAVYSAADIEALVKKIAAIEDIGGLDIIFDEETVEMLGLDVSDVKQLNTAALDEFYTCLFNEKKNCTPAGVSDVQNMIDAAYLIYRINNEDNPETIKDIINENNGVLGLDSSCSMDIYSDKSIYDDARRISMLSKIKEKKYSSSAEFRKSFGDRALLYAVYGQDSYHTIEAVLKQSKIIKEYDLSRYNALKDKTTVLKNLNAVKTPYETVAELAAAIENWAKGGGNTSGGKTSSGGGKTVISVPAEGSKPADISTEDADKGFTDISGFEWAREAILSLKGKRIVSGKSENRFHPGDNITREEFLKLLISVSATETKSITVDFEDVTQNDWYYSYVAAGVKAGIVKGKDNNRFGAGELITREDMAVMAGRLMEYMGIKLPAGEDVFSDSESISGYAVDYVRKLSSNKIINGVGENKFEPKLYLNRASAAKIVYEMDKLIQGSGNGGQ